MFSILQSADRLVLEKTVSRQDHYFNKTQDLHFPLPQYVQGDQIADSVFTSPCSQSTHKTGTINE